MLEDLDKMLLEVQIAIGNLFGYMTRLSFSK